jgi:3-phytase
VSGVEYAGELNRWRSFGKPIEIVVLMLLLVSMADAASPKGGPARPVARAETLPVPHGDDAADDPAIWIHPTSPELSLILGTDKQGGLHVYNLDGTERTVVAHDSKPNNVDVLYGFNLRGRPTDLAVMTTRADHARGLQVWAIDSQTRELSDVTQGGTLSVVAGDEPYGCCGYKNPRTGAAYVFVTSKSGAVEQYVLRTNHAGRVDVERVRAFKFKSTVEACVADDELGVVYFGEETRGIWKVSAEPSPHRPPVLIAKVDDNGLHNDVEGLAIYYGRNGTGYLIVSSQGNNTFKIYERGEPHRFVTTIAPVAGKFGDVEDTDGIAVSNNALPPLFPKGLFIAQDGRNGRAKQNFKLFAWEDIAGTNLLIDITLSPQR